MKKKQPAKAAVEDSSKPAPEQGEGRGEKSEGEASAAAAPKEEPISQERMESKRDQTLAATLVQSKRLLDAQFAKAYKLFQECYLDHVEAHPNELGKKFKLSFGRRRTFTTEQQAVASEQMELPASSGRDS